MRTAATRVKLYDASEIARNLRTTFTAKPVKGEKELPFCWPVAWHHVGDSLGVAYDSDKWKREGDYELYKHIAESRNRVLVQPGFLRDRYNPAGAWPTIGPMVSFTDILMPKHFAVLGYFEEADLLLHTRGTDIAPAFGPSKDDGIVQVTVKHAKLGASQMKTSTVSVPFLVVYSEKDGPLMFIVGDELDVEKDGIVG